MPKLPLARSAYKRGDLPEVPLSNLFFEVDPLNQDDQVSLLARGGLSSFATVGSGPIRGIWRQDGALSGVFVVVSGTSLYKVTTSGTVTQITGTISGTAPVRMTGSASTVLISNDATLYSTDGSTLSTVSLPDTFTPGDIGYINGRFIVCKKDTHRYYWSGVGNTTFNALDYASAEMSSDPLISVGIATDEVWFLGSETVEVSQPTADPNAPFVRVQGRSFSMGCATKLATSPFNNGVAWVGNDNAVWLAAGEVSRLSNSAIEERIRNSTRSDLRATRCYQDGHEFYVLTLSDGTVAYDAASKLWADWTSYGKTVFRGHLMAPLGSGQWVAGDATDGKLWLFSTSNLTDNGDPISREFGAWLQLDQNVRNNNVLLDCTVGSAASLSDDPMIALRYSDDRGHGWSSWMLSPLGRQGQYQHVAEWRQLGLMKRPGRSFHFRVTDAVNITIRRALINERV